VAPGKESRISIRGWVWLSEADAARLKAVQKLVNGGTIFIGSGMNPAVRNAVVILADGRVFLMPFSRGALVITPQGLVDVIDWSLAVPIGK